MPPPARILMTTDCVGGVWSYATTLARKLADDGCCINLVTLGPEPRNDQLETLHGIRGLDLTVTDLALEWQDPEGEDIARSRVRLSELERWFKPDVVHLNGFREALGEWTSPVVVVAHSCVGSWWQACRGAKPSEARWLTYMANVGAGLNAAHCWVAPTRAFCDCIEQLYSPATPGRVIWNGAERSFPELQKEKFILMAGRLWDEAKNISAVIDVAERIWHRREWPIRIAGPIDGSDLNNTRGPAGMELLGRLPHELLIKQMQRAAIFVAPAHYEPFGLTVLEAALAGCALVLSDLGSFRELWDGDALFVDARDRAALQSALERLIRDDALRCTLQRRAARRARRYSLTAMAAAYRNVYRAMPQLRSASSGRHPSYPRKDASGKGSGPAGGRILHEARP